MKEKEAQNFKKLSRSMSTEDLVAATSVHRHEYIDEILEFMDKELEFRQITSSEKMEIERNLNFEHEMHSAKYSGVKGWLLFFTLTIGFSSLLFAILGIYILSVISGIDGSVFFIMLVLMIPYFLIDIYGFWVFHLLINGKKGAPFHAGKFLIYSFWHGTIIGFVIWMSKKDSISFVEFIISLLPAAIILQIWLEYLCKSKRVSATYKE